MNRRFVLFELQEEYIQEIKKRMVEWPVDMDSVSYINSGAPKKPESRTPNSLGLIPTSMYAWTHESLH